MPRHVNKNGVDGSVGLARFVKMFPTPCATDHKGAGKKGKTRDRLDYAVERGQTKNSIFEPNESGGRLNPDWVDWMMNFPVGWTSLKNLSTQEWQKWNEADFSNLSNQWYYKEPTEKTTKNNDMRADRLMATGNAQVPACAAIAFLILRGTP